MVMNAMISRRDSITGLKYVFKGWWNGGVMEVNRSGPWWMQRWR